MFRLADSVRAHLRGMSEALASVVLSAPCRICGRMLDTGSRIPFCHACLDALRKPLPGSFCDCCGRPIVSTAILTAAGPPLCHLCRREVYDFDLARSFGAYTKEMARAVLLLKYHEVAPLGGWFAERLGEIVQRELARFASDVVVPVPLHPARLRERGYNQAELIARPLARLLRIPYRSYLLVRTKPRPDKLKLTYRERWTSVRGAYAAREGVRVDKLRVMLVDDVFTTGATLDACSKVLHRAGAAQVAGLTVARALPTWVMPGAAEGYQDLEE